ncbi:hypothetical protein DE146DRAFT_662712 [Phaeosphaeria sp. MPI-PUGE-AT-0046c]|nr:hypothetical protein DE146DRAFT_662712 [Phaeosphaeria sp. MPI-PUGE-AT-0046c]
MPNWLRLRGCVRLFTAQECLRVPNQDSKRQYDNHLIPSTSMSVPSRSNSVRKRSRACEECHRLKIKCDVSPSPGGACERCIRNGLVCEPAAPRLQRDRISELEAQVQELTIALREKSSSATPTRSPASSVDSHDQFVLSILDSRIPFKKQQELLQYYISHAGTAWPVVRLRRDLDYIRTKSPVLLLSILVYTLTQEAQGTESDVHDELIRETMHVVGDEVIARGQRSLELVQALLITAFWNKPSRSGQASCYQIVQLAVDMAIDLGIAGVFWQPSPVAYFSHHEDPASVEARRTWLACFVAISTSSMSMRRPNTIPWNGYHQECLMYLENTGDQSDMLLCQIVRITKLIEDAAIQMRLCQLAEFVDGNDYNTYAAIDMLKNNVDAWAAQIPPNLATSTTLKVLYHVAMVHIYEVALHTPTNKTAFVAPFLPGRIPVKDIPAPANIILPLGLALETIIQNCQAVIDTLANMDSSLVLSLPSFCFAPNILYSLYVLVTTLVTASYPGNTYSQCVDKDRIRIEEYGLKLRVMTSCLKALDPTMSCWTTRMIDATSWLEDWYNDYAAIVARYESNAAMS